MKLANKMMEHMGGEPCVEELKNEIERLKRENETLRENYVRDVAEAAAGAYRNVCLDFFEYGKNCFKCW